MPNTDLKIQWFEYKMCSELTDGPFELTDEP